MNKIPNIDTEQQLSLSVHTCTGSWVSDTFQFKRGVFQGDPLTPIIFNWVFNPIITSITSNLKLGYTLMTEIPNIAIIQYVFS